MSFRVQFMARSRCHALQLLEGHKSHLPAPVFDFIAIALNTLPPPRRDFSQAVAVKAFGHLCSGGESAVSSGDIEVKSIDIPD